MEGDKRWRSICTLSMSLLALVIVLLLSLALCPRFYWSEINQIVVLNNTNETDQYPFSDPFSTYPPSLYSHATHSNDSLSPPSPYSDVTSHLVSPRTESTETETFRDHLSVHIVNVSQHISLYLNLWHINYCVHNDTWTMKTMWIRNGTSTRKKWKNITQQNSNDSCSYITYTDSGTLCWMVLSFFFDDIHFINFSFDSNPLKLHKLLEIRIFAV